MKTLQTIIWITIVAILVSCKSGNMSFPKTTFDSSFPKRNINLDKFIGDHLIIKTCEDTLSLTINSTRKLNLITNSKTGDTIFLGTVSRFRGLFYFNQQLNDSSYWIYAVKITENLIYGLNTAFDQSLLVDAAIENGLYPELVKYQTPENIRLHPDKRELKKLFTSILDSISPDTIINYREISSAFIDINKIESQIDPEEFEFITKVYPNPAKDYIIIDRGQRDNIVYQIINNKGQSVLNGNLLDKETKIDLVRVPYGVYVLILLNEDTKQKEVIKIMKTK